MHKRWFFLFLS